LFRKTHGAVFTPPSCATTARGDREARQSRIEKCCVRTIEGESGTGKEVVANVIHRGAFTGAIESFRGVIRAAEGGTLLLRFLDSKEIHPLGEATPQRVAVRIVAATNADLERDPSSRTAT
jgi:DNA-binding NtrC family response regulator